MKIVYCKTILPYLCVIRYSDGHTEYRIMNPQRCIERIFKKKYKFDMEFSYIDGLTWDFARNKMLGIFIFMGSEVGRWEEQQQNAKRVSQKPREVKNDRLY